MEYIIKLMQWNVTANVLYPVRYTLIHNACSSQATLPLFGMEGRPLGEHILLNYHLGKCCHLFITQPR